VTGPKPKQPADIDWRGDSLDVLSSWPDEVKQTLGFELRNVQNGERPSDSKPLKDVGKGVFELREEAGNVLYRIAYLPRRGDEVVVLHCFEKQGQKTSKDDKRTIETRLSERMKEKRENKR
jgi:phage-related protein